MSASSTGCWRRVCGAHGWLVPAGDIEALTQVMRACLDVPTEVLMRMGEAAHQRVVERHDAHRETAKLAALFGGPKSMT